MEELVAREAEDASWTLQSDKDLLKALQDLSGDIMASISRLEESLSNLERRTRSITMRAGTASASFKELCQTRYIQQVVPQPSIAGRADGESQPPLLTATDLNELVQQKYREALQVSVRAFQKHEGESPWQPLPNVFGSPEYLQDATFGIGTLAAGKASSEIEETKNASIEQDDGPEKEEPKSLDGEDEPFDTPIPDFKSLCRSMLEAALRGDLEGGTLESLDSLDEELAEEGEISSPLRHSVDDIRSVPFSSPQGKGTKSGSGSAGEGRAPIHGRTQDSRTPDISTLSRNLSSDALIEGSEAEGYKRKDQHEAECSEQERSSLATKAQIANEPSLHALLYDNNELFSDDEDSSHE